MKNISSKENRIYNIEDFKTFNVEVDLNNPKMAQNTFYELTEEVEKECPVGKHFFDDVMRKNVAYEEDGKIWFEKENGFTDKLKTQLEPKFKEIRNKYPDGVNHIKFNLI